VKAAHALTALLLSAAAACGGSVVAGPPGSGGAGGDTSTSSTTGTGTNSCAMGAYAEPGCGDPPPGLISIQAGCYEACSSVGATCAEGGTCQNAWTNPCLCPDPNGVCCGACGGEQLLCVK